VVVSAIMKCSVTSEPRAGYGSPSFSLLVPPGKVPNEFIGYSQHA
jgi:hypothetical protein